MKITFYGAALCVTGSMTLLEACGKRILIDCGLSQGSDAKRGQGFDFDPKSIDAVLVTHAHIDHSGRLPYLYKLGFRGPVFCTPATHKLCSIMLIDSAKIQESDAVWLTKKALRLGKKPVEPLYTEDDARGILEYFTSYSYGRTVNIAPGLDFRCIDAGHLLGSAFIEVFVVEDKKASKLVFSGDIGNLDQPIINDPSYISHADYVIMESTYADRNHQAVFSQSQSEDELRGIIISTFARGGKIIMPTFSVGRTQEVLYLLAKVLPTLGFKVPVYLDSPLSIKATEVFATCIAGYYDKQAMELVEKGINPLDFDTLIPIEDAEKSKTLNTLDQACIIISSSGMCEAGRIRHHLKHNLWKSESSIVFTGYQAEGTLGRSIVDGKKMVKVLGEQLKVRAQIYKMEGLSGHADRSGLDKWIGAFASLPRKVFVIHGEKENAELYALHLSSDMGMDAVAPAYGQSFTI